MNITTMFQNIRSVYQAISGKIDADVSLLYKGTNHGISKPWQVRVDARESNSETYDGALNALFNELKIELNKKVASTEAEADRLRKYLATLDN